MSKSGNYNLSEIEKRDEIIQDLKKALDLTLSLLAISMIGREPNHAEMRCIEKARAAIFKVEGE